MENLLTKAQLAAALQCSTRFIERCTKEGMPVHHVGSHCRFYLSEVLAWQDQVWKRKEGLKKLTAGLHTTAKTLEEVRQARND